MPEVSKLTVGQLEAMMFDAESPSTLSSLQIIEDKLAIYELIASHPPSADTAHSVYTASVYFEDGVFDRGPILEGAYGVENIAAFTLKPAHKEAIRGGLAHLAGLPLVDLRGSTATVKSYLAIIHLDHEGDRKELPNHGFSTGHRIYRLVANRWELKKHDGCWKIAKPMLLLLDGSDGPLQLLRQALDEKLSLVASITA